MQTVTQKRTGVIVLRSDKTDFKIKNYYWRQRTVYNYLKKSMHQEDIIIIKIYAPSNRVPKYINQKLTEFKEEMESSIIIVGLQYPTFNNG